MESSKVLGGSEECSSSESGWTMYIASPVHEDNYYENNDLDHSGNKDEYSDKSDDSMASDASSRPSHQKLPYGSTKVGHHVLGHFKQSSDPWEDRRSKCCSSGKKPSKQAEKKTHEKRTKAEKQFQLPGHNPNSDAGHAQTGGAKVRKPKKEKK